MKKFRQQRRPKKNTLLVGPLSILEAMKSGQQIDRIYIATKKQDETYAMMKTLAAEQGVPINYVPPAKLNFFNVTNHGGYVAQLAKVKYQQLQDVISHTVEKGETPFLLLLDGITDIRNIGGIARTAFCMGVQAIVIPEKGVGALHEDAILTSAGALEKIAVCRVKTLTEAVDLLHLNGITVLASEMKAATKIDEVDFTLPSAIVMGGEEKGIHESLLNICDAKIKIPMPGDFESLNVSVATGIILYEAMKQRLK